MSTIKKMTIEEVKAMPPLSDEEKKIINEANPVESDDCPSCQRNTWKNSDIGVKFILNGTSLPKARSQS